LHPKAVSAVVGAPPSPSRCMETVTRRRKDHQNRGISAQFCQKIATHTKVWYETYDAPIISISSVLALVKIDTNVSNTATDRMIVASLKIGVDVMNRVMTGVSRRHDMNRVSMV